MYFSTPILWKTSDAGTVYNFDNIDVDGKPEVQFKCLKIMVGERGFEPPTPLVPNQILALIGRY